MGIKTQLTVGVNRLLARVHFGDAAVKLQHLIPELKVAMDAGVARFVSQKYAPNHFILYLSVGDLAAHAPLLDAFRHAVVEELNLRATDKGWSLLADGVTLDLQAWSELAAGDFRIDARIVEAKDAAALPIPAPPAPEPVVEPSPKDAPPIDGVTVPLAPAATAVVPPRTRKLMELEDKPTDVATAVFKVLRGANPGKIEVMAGREAIVGRGADADLQLADDSISRQHARLFLKDGRLGFEDLGSTAGTRVDGGLVDQGWLRPGGTLQLGDTVLELMYLPGVSA